MSFRAAPLAFSQAPAFFPPGAPLDEWEVLADSDHLFEIDGGGRLIRIDRNEGVRWATNEYTGSFTVTFVPKQSDEPHMFVLFIVRGVVNHMCPVTLRDPVPISALDWRWVLEELVVDQEAVEGSRSYRGCLAIIQGAESEPGFKSGDEKVDTMVGMALCRPALLKSKSARNALEYLEDHQLRAISGWHRAHPN